MSEPKHRRCTKRRHHVWEYRGPVAVCWTIARCVKCGLEELV